MDELYTNAMVEMGVSLTELAIKGTASAVNKKIKQNKLCHEDKRQIKEYRYKNIQTQHKEGFD